MSSAAPVCHHPLQRHDPFIKEQERAGVKRVRPGRRRRTLGNRPGMSLRPRAISARVENDGRERTHAQRIETLSVRFCFASTSSSPSTSSTGLSPRFLNSSSGTLPPSATSLTCAVRQTLSLQTAGSPEHGRDGAAPPSSCTCKALRLSLWKGHDPVLRHQAHRKHLQRHERGFFPGRARETAAIQLDRINYAASVNDLRVPPGNRLERLRGKRAGQYSIRVSRGWRICFVWQDGDAFEVELTNHYA